jgi:hypothetical protein
MNNAANEANQATGMMETGGIAYLRNLFRCAVVAATTDQDQEIRDLIGGLHDMIVAKHIKRGDERVREALIRPQKPQPEKFVIKEGTYDAAVKHALRDTNSDEIEAVMKMYCSENALSVYNLYDMRRVLQCFLTVRRGS